MVRDILTVPNKTLRLRCKLIKEIDSTIKALADELVELTGRKHHGLISVGIAAPQIGELVRMFVYRPNPHSTAPNTVIVINPELVYAKGKVILKESCLSLPGKEFFVLRHKIVKVRGLTINGEVRSFKGRGLLAQTLEHELNHLDGILIDKIGKKDRVGGV